MQIVSKRDNMHEIWNPVFWYKIKKKKNEKTVDFFTQHAISVKNS